MMEKSGYTPGPWTFEVVTTAGVAIVSSRWGDAARVNTCVGDSARRDANARLIAAAPDLLEIVSRYVGRDVVGGETETDLHRAARAALNKAGGK